MHPPTFQLSHHLLDWPECRLELKCCKGSVLYPVRLLAQKKGNLAFETVLRGLKCSACGQRPKGPIFLCAGPSRTPDGGAPPDWAVQIQG